MQKLLMHVLLISCSCPHEQDSLAGVCKAKCMMEAHKQLQLGQGLGIEGFAMALAGTIQRRLSILAFSGQCHAQRKRQAKQDTAYATSGCIG